MKQHTESETHLFAMERGKRGKQVIWGGGGYGVLAKHLDAIEAVGHRIDDDVHIVELTGYGLWVVVPLVLTPHNVNRVIAYMTFLWCVIN